MDLSNYNVLTISYYSDDRHKNNHKAFKPLTISNINNSTIDINIIPHFLREVNIFDRN